ncbi:hypothetical protein WR25_06796 [Diploscapter pachys]|uniref:Flap endonuclease 1 n=1 Tax=Diploscapter pachys TaxID=2018661 RepID=A0A2A2KYI6_9BILA|nr:hypothetical protein WR25_06796 [Diploscapter pachys]
MGIKGLSQVIADHAPAAIKTIKYEENFGRKVAVDASMCLYQFLIAGRQQDGTQLQSESGDVTSHLMGMFYRTIRMVANGIKPVYVFDGKPPDMKSGELVKRSERRAEAEKALAEAKEKGEVADVDKFERRLVTKEQNEEVKKLLTLMGVPVVEAPCEAEAQCAALVKSGKVYATATEDMDALTFGSSILLRNIVAAESKKLDVKEFNLKRVLEGMKLEMSEFVDFCILLGCDYCSTIRGIGPKKAYELIQQHRSIDAILENIDIKKYPPPEEWPYARARELFQSPEVQPAEDVQLVWKDPDTEGVIAFMCGEKSFNEERIRSSLAKLQKSRQGGTQFRIDSFFAAAKIVKSEPTTAAKKRKLEEEASKKGKGKGADKKRGPPIKKAK